MATSSSIKLRCIHGYSLWYCTFIRLETKSILITKTTDFPHNLLLCHYFGRSIFDVKILVWTRRVKLANGIVERFILIKPSEPLFRFPRNFHNTETFLVIIVVKEWNGTFLLVKHFPLLSKVKCLFIHWEFLNLLEGH